MACPKKVVEAPAATPPSSTKNTRSVKSVVLKAASNATPAVTLRKVVQTPTSTAPASARGASITIPARSSTRKRNAASTLDNAPSAQRPRTEQHALDPFGIEDEYNIDSGPDTVRR